MQYNYDITHLTTFGIHTKAKQYISFQNREELTDLIKSQRLKKPFLILGGGSNLLFLNDYEGTVIHPQNKHITILEENKDNVLVEAGSGVVWDDFVAYCVDNGFGGAENLSLIPGNIGAAPVQNVGAYGVEVGNLIHSVHLVEIETGEEHIFSKEQCEFGYRDSVFKNTWKNRAVVTSVEFELKKNSTPSMRYGHLKTEVEKLGEISIENVRKAVIDIRNSKLPDPGELGNGGSFFKNPVIKQALADSLKEQHPTIPTYPAENGQCKLAAGWLIDQAGWKGYRKGDAGVHKHQALVLVNYGKATGQDILSLSQEIQKDIFEKFGVELEREVLAIGKQ